MPYTIKKFLWNEKEADETIELPSEFERTKATLIEITTTGFSGTLDIQGKLYGLNAYSNIPYIRQDIVTQQNPSVAQLSFTTDTGVYRYLVLGYWARVQLVMTRTAGSITGAVAGSSSAQIFSTFDAKMGEVQTTPTANTLLRRLKDLLTGIVLAAGTNAIGKLAANSGVDIGDVDVTSIATGTNAIGKVGHDVTGIGHGTKVGVTTPATAESLVASSTPAKLLIVQAITDNTGIVAIGGSGVVATVADGTGIVLYPGETITLPIDDVADVYMDALATSQGVRFVYLT